MAIERVLASKVLSGYSPASVRFFCYLRFAVLQPLLFQVIEPSLNGCREVLDIGCGYGLISCLLSVSHPSANIAGMDINPRRIRRAREAAVRIQADKLHFWCADARSLELKHTYDAILLIDVLHHVNNPAKYRILQICARSLAPGGLLVIKDILPRPSLKFLFTYLLDIIVTGGRELWYWDAVQFQAALAPLFEHVESPTLPGFSPYPHTILICRSPYG